MICAPTMIGPGSVPTHNAFYAMAAVLNAITRNRDSLTDVFCPGSCTGLAAVPPSDAASEMAHAHAKWVRSKANA